MRAPFAWVSAFWFVNLCLQVPLALSFPTMPFSSLFLEVSVFCNASSLLFCGDAGALPYFSVPYGSVPFGRSLMCLSCIFSHFSNSQRRGRAAEPLATQKIGNSWNIYTYQIYNTCLFLSRIFWREASLYSSIAFHKNSSIHF